MKREEALKRYSEPSRNLPAGEDTNLPVIFWSSEKEFHTHLDLCNFLNENNTQILVKRSPLEYY